MEKKKMLIITGLSGAGKTTCLGLLEDIGYFCVDNIPPKLLKSMLPLFEQTEADKIAFGIDVRWKQAFNEMIYDIKDFIKNQSYYTLSIIFLEAGLDVISKRYALTRRKHPLSSDGTVAEAYEMEKEMLSPLRENADFIIDTTGYNTHQLRQALIDALEEETGGNIKSTEINVTSFGFKYGTPLNADFIIDSRFLPNPYWKPELSSYTGLEKPVQDYLNAFPVMGDYITACTSMLLLAVERYNEEGRSNINVYIGCSGGKHRSVYIGSRIHEFFIEHGFRSQLSHRELERMNIEGETDRQ